MAKKMVVVALTFVLSLSTLFGCFGGDEEQPKVDKLSIEGDEVLLRMGDSYYTADDLFGDMLNNQQGANKAFEEILRIMVNHIVPKDHTSVAFQVDAQYDEFIDQVEQQAEQQGVDFQELKDASLEEEGFSSVEEFKRELAVSFQFEIAERDFWNDNKDEYWKGHIEDRLQYYLRHVLVNIPSGNDRDLFYTNISENNAEDLYDVFKMIENDNTFSSVANILSDDPGSAEKGGAYKMDFTTEFVNEFRVGVVAFDAFSRDVDDVDFGDLEGINDNVAVEMDRIYGDGFDAIPASYFYELYEKKGDASLNEEDLIDEMSKDHPFSSNDRDSVVTPRNIIFNTLFNNPGISMIHYDIEPEGDYPENTCEFDFAKGEGENPQTKRVMCDQDQNPIFITRGSHGVHFLVIEHSPFDLEETAEFFALEYDREAEYETYINMFDPSVSERNKRIDELEGLARNYAERGIEDCVTCPLDERFFYFDMYEHYLEKLSEDSDFEIDPFLKEFIEGYIQISNNDADLGYELKISRYVESYVSKIDKSNSEMISQYRVPTECLEHNDENKICGFNSEDGFHLIDTEGGE